MKFEEAAEPDPARWASSQAEGGRFDGIVDLTRLADGRVMCQLCFGYFTRDQLWTDDAGATWDVCARCHAWEERVAAIRASGVPDGATEPVSRKCRSRSRRENE